ncbi:MAG TPA: hypothetical protein EYQ58_03210 [Candidatus Poseidoniales archaeon]|nr:hypothetical protein [Candidatus Poseidoniales archaeon]
MVALAEVNLNQNEPDSKPVARSPELANIGRVVGFVGLALVVIPLVGLVINGDSIDSTEMGVLILFSMIIGTIISLVGLAMLGYYGFSKDEAINKKAFLIAFIVTEPMFWLAIVGGAVFILDLVNSTFTLYTP